MLLDVLKALRKSAAAAAPRHVRREEYGDRIVYWYRDPKTGKMRSSTHHKKPGSGKAHQEELPEEHLGQEKLEALVSGVKSRRDFAVELLRASGQEDPMEQVRAHIQDLRRAPLHQIPGLFKVAASPGLAKFILDCKNVEWLLALYAHYQQVVFVQGRSGGSGQGKEKPAGKPASQPSAPPEAEKKPVEPKPAGQAPTTLSPRKVMSLIRLRLAELGFDKMQRDTTGKFQLPPKKPAQTAKPAPKPPRSPDTPKPAPAAAAPPEPSQEGGEDEGKGSRRKHVEVGEHVGGSRADEFARNPLNGLRQMTMAEAVKTVKRAKLAPIMSPQEAQEHGMSPGGYLAYQVLLKSVDATPKAKDKDQLLAYAQHLGVLVKSLEGCRTHADVMQVITERKGMIEAARAGSYLFMNQQHASDWLARQPFKATIYQEGHRWKVAPKVSKLDMLAVVESAVALGQRHSRLLANGLSGATRKEMRQAQRWERAAQGWDDPEVREALGLDKAAGKKKRAAATKRDFSWKRAAEGEPERVGGRAVHKADAQAMADEFGLTNVQFGNYVTDSDAEHHLVACHGALRDLADILGISPRQVSYNNRLALGIGARGKGHASAHYEPSRKIINLTKFAGGGSLAHEWGHFMDNVLAELYTDAGKVGVHRVAGQTRTKAGAQLGSDMAHVSNTLPPDLAAAYKGVMDAILYDTPEAMHENDYAQRTHERNALRMKMNVLKRQSRIDEFNALVDKFNALNAEVERERRRRSGIKSYSNYANDAQRLGNYYAMHAELFARAFEAYIEDKLHAAGRHNTYLVTGARKIYRTGDRGQPYPQGKDRQRISDAFDSFMGVVRGRGHLTKALAFWRQTSRRAPQRDFGRLEL